MVKPPPRLSQTEWLLMETLWRESRSAFKARTSSQYRGVFWSRHHRAWVSRIQFDHRIYQLGHFDSEADAARAYDRKAVKFYGGRARLNFHPKTGEELGGRMLDPPVPRERLGLARARKGDQDDGAGVTNRTEFSV